MAKSDGRAWAALAVVSMGSASAAIAKALASDADSITMMELGCARKSLEDASRFLADAEANLRLPG